MTQPPRLQIADRKVGPGLPTLVIAEIGVNHDGSLERALELVQIASNCGADAVKIQLFTAAALLHPSAEIAVYQKTHAKVESPFDLLRRYELSMDACRVIVARIRALGMIPLATPFSPDDVETIAQLDLPCVKIASPDVVNRLLISRVAQTGKPLLVSTGAATMEEIQTSMQWLGEWHAPVALLHCISSYPTPSESANLGWIAELATAFAVPIGYSDHVVSLLSGALAVAGGACIVERHLTHDRAAEGPDHAASSDPQQFAEYVKLVREAEVFRGSPGKRVLPIEDEVRRISRQSLVLRHATQVGQTLAEPDLTVQRPGTGVSAADVSRVIGRRVVRAAKAGEMLEWGMLADVA